MKKIKKKQKMKKIKKKQQILIVACVFVFGFIFGFEWKNGFVSSILSSVAAGDSQATRSNATHSNATQSNATQSNATRSNATRSNATSSNPTTNNTRYNSDNVLFLHMFNLGSETVKAGDKLTITIGTSGALLNGASIVFQGSSPDITFSANLNFGSGVPFIVIPTTVSSGDYHVLRFILHGKNSDGSTFSKIFTSSLNEPFYTYYEFNSSVNITNSQDKKVGLNSISLGSSGAKVNEKVNISIDTTDSLKSLKLKFIDDNSNVMNVYAQSLDKNPFFEIPSNTIISTYRLVNAVLETNDCTTVYDINGENGDAFAFDVTLVVEEGNSKLSIYNNEDITDAIIAKLYSLEDGAEIVINAAHSSVISSELYNVIKGTNKKLVINYKDNQIVFNGDDIKSPKTIDASIVVDKIQNHESIKKLVDDGVLLRFADNGNLPGVALIRVKATDDIQSILNEKKVYIYVYNEDTNNFCEVATNISRTKDGYYEFKLSHNSDYIMVNSPLKRSLVVADDYGIVSFQKGKNIYLLLIGIAVLAIIVLVVVIVLQKKKYAAIMKKNNKEKETEEKSKEKSEKSEKKESSKKTKE